jgi:hypothetical protein
MSAFKPFEKDIMKIFLLKAPKNNKMKFEEKKKKKVKNEILR